LTFIKEKMSTLPASEQGDEPTSKQDDKSKKFRIIKSKKFRIKMAIIIFLILVIIIFLIIAPYLPKYYNMTVGKIIPRPKGIEKTATVIWAWAGVLFALYVIIRWAAPYIYITIQ